MRTRQEIIDYRNDLLTPDTHTLPEEEYIRRLTVLQTLNWILEVYPGEYDQDILQREHDAFKQSFIDMAIAPRNEHDKFAVQILCAKVSTLAWVLDE